MAEQIVGAGESLRKQLYPEVVNPDETMSLNDRGLGQEVANNAANASGLAPTIYNGSGKKLDNEGNESDWYDRDVTNEGVYTPDAGPQSFTAGEQMNAFFETENVVSSYMAEETAGDTFDRDFDALQTYEWQTYPELQHQLIHANNTAEISAIANNHVRETRNREIIEQSSLGATLGYSALAMTLDPILLPAMVFTGGQAFTARIGARGAAALWGATAGTSEIIAEAMKHDSQQLRTVEESYINIASATFLSGLMGGWAGSVAAKDVARAKVASDKYVREVFGDVDEAGQPKVMSASERPAEVSKSAGAAQVGATKGYEWQKNIDKPDDLQLKSALGLEKLGANPLVRMSKSRVPLVRRMAVLLADSPYYYKAYDEGKAITGTRGSVVSQKRQYIAQHVMAVAEVNDIYLKYRGVGSTQAALKDLTKATEREGMMPYREFQREIGKSLRRREAGDNEFINQATEVLRKKSLNPIMEDAIDAGIFDDGIRNVADTYFPRLYDFDRLRAESDDRVGGFSDKVFNYLAKEQDQAKMDLQFQGSRIEHAESQAAKARQDVENAKQTAIETGNMTNVYKEVLKADINPNDPEQVRQFMRAKKRPLSLAAWVRDNGGISDAGGELAARDISNDKFVGVYSKSGESEEHFIRKAVEDGYYDTLDYNEISLDRFRDDLANDVNGEKLYNLPTRDALNELAAQQENALYRQATQDMGLTGRSTKGEIDAAMAKAAGDVPTPEKLKGLKKYAREMDDVVRDTQARIDAYEEFGNLTERDLRGIASDIKAKILSLKKDEFEESFLPDIGAFKAGNLKDRKLKIDDLEIEDYLISDADDVIDFYTKAVSPQVIMAREFGDIHLTKPKQAIHSQYTQMRNELERELHLDNATPKKITKELQKLDKEQRQAISDIDALRDKLNGQYNRPEDPNSFWNQAGHFIKAFNYMRMLGGMTIAAIPDLARPVMTQGIKPVFRTLSALKGDKAIKNAAMKDLKAAGAAIEAISTNMTNRYSDVTQFSGARTKLERGVETGTNIFSKLTFMPQWNDALKGFSGLTVQNEMARAVLSSAPTPRQIRELAKQGIGEEQISHLRHYLNKYGEDGDLYIPNGDNWGNEMLPFKRTITRAGEQLPNGKAGPSTKETITEMREVTGAEMRNLWRSAVGKTVNEIIVTPGIGEMPLWVSGPVASVVMQFKSFPISAHNRILMSGLQARDKEALGGLIFAIGMGAIVNEIRSAQSGRDTPDDMGDYIFDAVDRGGVLGWLNEPIQAASMMSRGKLAVNQAWGGEQARVSRYQSRNLLGAFLGPSADMVGDISAVSGAISTGDFSDGDISAGRKLLPAQNLFYFKWLLMALED